MQRRFSKKSGADARFAGLKTQDLTPVNYQQRAGIYPSSHSRQTDQMRHVPRRHSSSAQRPLQALVQSSATRKATDRPDEFDLPEPVLELLCTVETTRQVRSVCQPVQLPNILSARNWRAQFSPRPPVCTDRVAEQIFVPRTPSHAAPAPARQGPPSQARLQLDAVAAVQSATDCHQWQLNQTLWQHQRHVQIVSVLLLRCLKIFATRPTPKPKAQGH